ncbi:MAG: outer membrane protein assembly factor [Flammeovirgaceae bacterium]|nr:outer membrane protein assembly factor [Flammeovirgaceae bacterium]
MKKSLILILFFVVSVSFFQPLLGQNNPSHEAGYKSDTVEFKNFRTVLIPIIFYTPETQFGFGAGGQLFFRTKGSRIDTRLSNIFVSAIYTIKNQFIFDVIPKIYFKNEQYFFNGAFKYKIYPNNFWGIGNNKPDSNLEEYNMESYEIKAAFLKRLPPSLNFGFEYRFFKHDVVEVKEDGILASEDVIGSTGATLSGLGVVFNLDTRDNYFSPNHGHYLQLYSGFTSKAMGSTHSFNKYEIDTRKYFPIKENHLFAIQGYFEFNFGDVPFQNAAIFGGPDRTRGYFKGRYIDNHIYAIQAEYRYTFRPRWKAAAFVSAGEVADVPSNLIKGVKPSFGGGIRFQILKGNPSVVRLDYGIGPNGNSGFYFGVNEAF